jgi:O-antigen ligase/Flp pilus assembly protein TadD
LVRHHSDQDRTTDIEETAAQSAGLFERALGWRRRRSMVRRVDLSVGRWLVWPVIAFPALVVLAVDPEGYAPFGPAKYLVVAACALVGVVAVIVGPGVARCDRWPACVWAGLLVWLSIAATVGVDRFHGWIGLPERRLGVVAFTLFAACFVIAQSLRVADRRAIVLSAVVAGCIVGMWAVLEGLGLAPVDGGGATSRLTGPFGSAAYLGAATCLLIPVCLGAACDATTARGWRVAGWFGGATCAIGLVGSGTRGAWVGTIVAVGATAVVRRSMIKWVGRSVAVIAGLAVAAVVIGGWLLPETERPNDAVARTGTSGRLDEWSLAGRVIADRPLLGAGPEGYRIVAGQHVSVEYEQAYGRAVIPDRAHNGLLDLGVSGGIPALLGYAALLVLVGRRVFTVLRTGTPLHAGVAVGLVAYAAQQQFLFPLTEIDPVAWLLAGVVAAAAEPERPFSCRLPRWTAAISILLGGATLLFGVRELLADRAVQGAVEELASASTRADVDDAITQAEHAVSLRPDVLRNRIALSRAQAATGTIAGLDAAVAALDGALEWSPRDPVLAKERASVLSSKADATGDRADQRAALDAWTDAVANDPNNAASLLELGVAQAVNGDSEQARESWERAATLAPRSPVPLINLARLASIEGRDLDAEAALAEAEQRAPNDPAIAAVREALGLPDS